MVKHPPIRQQKQISDFISFSFFFRASHNTPFLCVLLITRKHNPFRRIVFAFCLHWKRQRHRRTIKDNVRTATSVTVFEFAHKCCLSSSQNFVNWNGRSHKHTAADLFMPATQLKPASTVYITRITCITNFFIQFDGTLLSPRLPSAPFINFRLCCLGVSYKLQFIQPLPVHLSPSVRCAFDQCARNVCVCVCLCCVESNLSPFSRASNTGEWRLKWAHSYNTYRFPAAKTAANKSFPKQTLSDENSIWSWITL